MECWGQGKDRKIEEILEGNSLWVNRDAQQLSSGLFTHRQSTNFREKDSHLHNRTSVQVHNIAYKKSITYDYTIEQRVRYVVCPHFTCLYII